MLRITRYYILPTAFGEHAFVLPCFNAVELNRTEVSHHMRRQISRTFGPSQIFGLTTLQFPTRSVTFSKSKQLLPGGRRRCTIPAILNVIQVDRWSTQSSTSPW